MAKLNVPRQSINTHEGSKAKHINPELQLRRSVMACMLWEREFYEDGVAITDRIASLILAVKPAVVAAMAVEARERMKLRHIPLFIVREMARHGKHKKYVADTLSRIIQRPDELTEFLAIYWKDGRQPLSAQVKKGLAGAFPKFDAYSLAKYNRDGAVKLRDALFLCHAKPKDTEQAETWKKLIEGTLEPPDTWEVSLSSGGDKKAHWERLLSENKMGAMAVLRNLRNFQQNGIDENLVFSALRDMKTGRVLPFRFIAAARHAPQWEDKIEVPMMKCLEEHTKIPGRTVLLLDVSGSMEAQVSGRSEISRLDAACGVAILLREICESVDIFSFSLKLIRIPPRHGFALRDAVVGSQEHSGTLLGTSVKAIYSNKAVPVKIESGLNQYESFIFDGQNLNPDRLVVLTDEQSHDPVPDPQGRGYMINLASNKNGVGYGGWTHIDGWSEAVIDYIKEYEHKGLTE